MNEEDDESRLQPTPVLIFKPCSPIQSMSSSSASPTATSSEGPDKMCPICLEEKQDFHFIICGHKVCIDCNRMLRENDCMNKCPVCRCPLNWMGYVEFNGENFVLRRDTPASVVQTVMVASENYDAVREIVIESGIEVQGVPVRPVEREREVRVGRRQRRGFQGAPDWECFGNMACAFVVVLFVVAFAYASTS